MPSPTIVLKDKDDADVTYHLRQFEGNRAKYVSSTDGRLVGTSQIDLALTSRQKVNRITAKLSLPQICLDPVCGSVSVTYTEVGSLDLSSVLQASEEVRENFIAQFRSLVNNQVVADMFVDGMI